MVSIAESSNYRIFERKRRSCGSLPWSTPSMPLSVSYKNQTRNPVFFLRRFLSLLVSRRQNREGEEVTVSVLASVGATNALNGFSTGGRHSLSSGCTRASPRVLGLFDFVCPEIPGPYIRLIQKTKNHC